MADVAVSPPGAKPAGGPPPGAPVVPDFQVIPLKLLAFPAIVFVALVAAIIDGGLFGLQFMHVVFGAGWTIVDLFMGFLIGPIMGSMSIQSRIELTAKLMPKMVVILPTLVTATLVAGWQLGNVMGTVDSGYVNHGWIVASYIVVGIMAVIALGLLEPANIAVLIELKKKHPNPEVIQRLMKRFIYTSGVTGAMQIGTLVIMVKVATG
jgi:hypothetical protein